MDRIKRFRLLLKTIWRTFFVQAWWNFERLQSLGLLYTILPFLKYLYENNPDKLQERKQFYEEYFNTNPIFFPILAGALCKLELLHSLGKVDKNTISTFKVRMMSTLGAIGDTLSWNGIRPMAALTSIFVTFLISPLWGLVTYLVIYNTFHLFIRVNGFFLGYKHSIAIIDKISRRNPLRLAKIIQGYNALISAIIFSYLIFWIYKNQLFSFSGLAVGPFVALIYVIKPSDLVTLTYFIILLIGEKLWPEIVKL